MKNNMKLSDVFLIIMIFAFSLLLNYEQIFTDENILSMLIVTVILGVLAIFLIRDYLPLFLLLSARQAYTQDNDSEKLQIAINTFKNKNKLLSHSYKAYLYESELKMQQGSCPAALESLLYCKNKDMNNDAKLKVALMRAKILMFMDQLESSNPEWEYCKQKQHELDHAGRFTFMLIKGYLFNLHGQTEKALQTAAGLSKYQKGEAAETRLWNAEAKWLNAMISLRNYSQHNYNSQLNMLKGCNAPKYIIKSIQRHEKKEQSI